jgi:hypothetical protein
VVCGGKTNCEAKRVPCTPLYRVVNAAAGLVAKVLEAVVDRIDLLRPGIPIDHNHLFRSIATSLWTV